MLISRILVWLLTGILFCIPKRMPNYQTISADYDRGIEMIKADGTTTRFPRDTAWLRSESS